VNDRNRNLLIRIATVVVLLPLVLVLLAKGGLWSAGLISLAAAACAGEYYSITGTGLRPGSFFGIVGAGLLPLWPWMMPLHAAEAAFWTLASVFVASWIVPLLRGPLNTAPTQAAHLFTGAAYGGVGLYALSAIRSSPHGLEWLVAALTVTWANDTMAYFAGRLFGKHKLYAEVSPNKTWEGFAGGFVGSVGGLFIARAVFASVLNPLDCVLLGLAGGVLGPMGDLCESMLKRAYNVKDSSHLIPGHGGFLDRIDALIFNSPLVFVYAQIVRTLWQ
jgi:phosphatidate cytidylyltransferase